MYDQKMMQYLGSSPLARGLRWCSLLTGINVRIIPARAGFTGYSIEEVIAVADHPRSRGVYRGYPMISVGTRGSSPLARGLRVAVAPQVEDLRIIPARAGFTERGAHGRGADQDHPRSRGVYPGSRVTMIRIVGSSPLARGLRVSGRERSPCGGIIPARAGFTETGAVSAAPGRDHPRSRGVYREGIRVDQANVGSSPLARGLLGLHGARLQGLRIIPARAGFTSLEQVGKREEEDHPRSRGVYLSTTWPGMGSPGSSPLARGLPHRHGAEPVGEGIIPARAGFTRGNRR